MQTVSKGMSLLDAVVASAGSLEDWFAFCLLNNLGFSDDVQPGELLQATGLSYPISRPPTNDQVTIKQVLTLFNQTSMDMSIQQLGSLEAWFALCALNGLNYSDDLATGQGLNYSITPYNKAALKIFTDNGYKPATGIKLPGTNQPVQLEGISYWAIGFDFIVS
jgi:hypothetical protein